jgi:1-acyl-sn-glycerol-3-phosphate acyltransferase
MPPWLSALWYDLGYWSSVAALTFGFSMRVAGRANVPRKGPALLLGNHESFVDPLAVGVCCPRRLFYLARKSLFKHRLFGAYLRSVNCVPVDQEGVAKEGLKTILDMLHVGRAVLVFPEGERTWDGHMQPFKPGIHLLIKRAVAPIVPIGVAGAFDAWPRTRKWPRLSPLFWPRTGSDIAIAIGKPIPSQRFQGLPREQVLEELRQEIQKLKERAQALRRKG